MPFLRTIGKRYNRGKGAKSRSLLSNLTALMPYFLDDHVFDRTNTESLTEPFYGHWREYLPALLSFACRHNFMRLSDKSIFEQASIRRESRHYPITYYDISAGGISEMSGREMNALISSFVALLGEHGVKAGDTVALAGINCTEHMAIDQAIGLIGATSVPIYYTTPAEEIALLLRKSHARWFFVGDERVRQNLGLIPSEVQIIPFGPLGSHEPEHAATGKPTLATGNAIRADEGLKKIGINLDEEFEELYAELPITTDHQSRWSPITKQAFDVMLQMGLAPEPMPKLLRTKRCLMCGHCSIGCPTRAKWDTRELLEGLNVLTGCKVTRIDIDGRQAKCVHITKGLRHFTMEADVIIVAAGGYGTPDILRNSGIDCQPTLFVDPVLCVAAPMEGVRQNRQLLMPFVSSRERYIISPYMDWLSFFFNRKWYKPMEGIASFMIKLADTEQGDVHDGHMLKTLTETDQQFLKRGAEDCRQILLRMGAEEKDIFLGTLNAGHPGGMLPLTPAEAETLHSPLLPDNLYVADATILPKALGLPPILTIMALAKRIAKNICRSM